jgi:hypothetical protein
VARCRDLLQRRLDATHSGTRRSSQREEMEMTIDSHDMGSERCHGQRKEDAKEVDKKDESRRV